MNYSRIIEDSKISWDSYFLLMLDIVKLRSPDVETQVSCILSENNRIISVGFNGWPNTLDNLPCSRNDNKYPYMIHSEQNAICNLLVKPIAPIAYITHYPCNVCLKMLWQIGCRRIVIPKNRKCFSFSEDDQTVLDLLMRNGLELVEIDNKKSNSGNMEFDEKAYRFVRVGQGISKVKSKHFGDFE